MNELAVSCRLSFGDSMFCTALTKAVAARNPSGKVDVVAGNQYADAYTNLPWIGRIVNDPQLLSNRQILESTPGDHFWHYKATNGEFCLFDTHLKRAQTVGIDSFDQRPIFIPTYREKLTVQQYVTGVDAPLLAVESVYFSGQSWSDRAATDAIVDRYAASHKILWLSNQDAPDHPAVDPCTQFSRRQLIQLLTHCELFYTTGSGFFCASLAHSPGPRTVCLWKDETYKYERRLAQLGWRDVEWVHNRVELEKSFK